MSQLHDLWWRAFSCSLLRPCGYTCKNTHTHTHKERAMEAATPLHTDRSDYLMTTYLLLLIINTIFYFTQNVLLKFPSRRATYLTVNGCYLNSPRFILISWKVLRYSFQIASAMLQDTSAASRKGNIMCKIKRIRHSFFFPPQMFSKCFYLSALIVSAKAKPQIHFISI